MKSIVTMTMNPALDKSTSTGRVIAEAKLRCESPSYEPGGGGINVSRAISRLGGVSTAFYVAGGPPGRMLKSLLREEGLDHKAIEVRGMNRENLIVYEESTGQQYRFGMPGPSLQDEEWHSCISELLAYEPGPDYLVLSGSLPPGVPDDFYGRLSRLAGERGAKVVVDTSGAALAKAAEAGVYLLKPNLRELQSLSGSEFKDIRGVADLAVGLVEQGRAAVVAVSLGAQGSLIATKEFVRRIVAPIVPIKSKVGAGDSMVGGLVLSLARGESFLEAAAYGVAAGTAAVMTPGTELCRKEDTEKLFEEIMETLRQGGPDGF